MTMHSPITLTESESSTKSPRPKRAAEALALALVDTRNGSILGVPDNGPRDEQLESLAAAVPEMLSNERISWELVFDRLQSDGDTGGLRDLVLVSRGHVYVALRLPTDPSLVLVGVAPRERGVGFVVSEARAALSRMGQAETA